MNYFKKHRVNVLGRVLARCPKNCKLLYPLYEAAHPVLKLDEFRHESVPPALDGFTIAYLSDLHYGACMPLERARALYERVNAFQADVVVMGGDYGAIALEGLALHRALPAPRARLATIAVMGNHDRSSDRVPLSLLMQAIEDAGATPVVNGALILSRNGARVAFASVDDCMRGEPDIEAAVEAARGADFTVFCPHSPDILPRAYFADRGRRWFQLALCGHTHGGQVALFGRGIVSSSDYGERFRTGWKQEYGIPCMISNGVGASFLPLRAGAPPQLHLITLRSEACP